MTGFDREFEQEYEEYLDYLYSLANRKYGDKADVDALVQESLLALLVKRRRGEEVRYPKAFLSSALQHKYNDMLREKYRSRIVSYEFPEELAEKEETDGLLQQEEYEGVRCRIGRLIRIYREVTVRYYVQGKSVEQIAGELGIPKGTVLSRLSGARSQIKEGLETMEKYSEVSFAPKQVSLGIWGSPGMAHEPFSLVSSPVEANILVLAYRAPVSLQGIADTMGMPCAYLEPAAEKLVKGELLGRTSGGLVYTRCFLQNYEDAFGDIPRQKAFAESHAEEVWRIAWKHLEVLAGRESFKAMSEKQKATMLLFSLWRALSKCAIRARPAEEEEPKSPQERPNGGRWLATGTVLENGRKRDNDYEVSGPVFVNYSASGDGKNTCQMFDCQSLFGDAHWGYHKFKYTVSLQTVLRFYASLLPCEVTVDNALIYELVPELEAMHILRRDEEGKPVLDIPALPFEEVAVWNPAVDAMEQELDALLREPLRELWLSRKNRVPKHVDCAGYYRHTSATGAYLMAQLVAIVKKGLLPYPVEIGKTPLIFVAYRKKE